MSRDDELDVLDPPTFPSQTGLERAERLVAAGAGVDLERVVVLHVNGNGNERVLLGLSRGGSSADEVGFGF